MLIIRHSRRGALRHVNLLEINNNERVNLITNLRKENMVGIKLKLISLRPHHIEGQYYYIIIKIIIIRHVSLKHYYIIIKIKTHFLALNG